MAENAFSINDKKVRYFLDLIMEFLKIGPSCFKGMKS